jgi:hypothetical protein
VKGLWLLENFVPLVLSAKASQQLVWNQTMKRNHHPHHPHQRNLHRPHHLDHNHDFVGVEQQ